MKRYTIGLITGILLTASTFMFMGAKNQSKNLGHITVNSITVLDDEDSDKQGGYIATYNIKGDLTAEFGTDDGGGGSISTYNANGEETVWLGTAKDNGAIQVYNAKGTAIAYVGTSTDGGFGFISTNNAKEQITGYLGTVEGGDGVLSTYSAKGKETVALGTVGGAGSLQIYNSLGKEVAYAGVSEDEVGLILLFDSNGNEVWGQEGVK